MVLRGALTGSAIILTAIRRRLMNLILVGMVSAVRHYAVVAQYDVANGDSAMKIWITEFGAPTSGPNSVGETGQSDQLVQAISQVKQLSWVRSFYIYTWADLSFLSADEDGFGLLTDDGAHSRRTLPSQPPWPDPSVLSALRLTRCGG